MAAKTERTLLMLVCDAEGYWLHNPATGADTILFHDEDQTLPIMEGEFFAARKKAFEIYPDADIRM